VTTGGAGAGVGGSSITACFFGCGTKTDNPSRTLTKSKAPLLVARIKRQFVTTCSPTGDG
jgi:hypothetical protein